LGFAFSPPPENGPGGGIRPNGNAAHWCLRDRLPPFRKGRGRMGHPSFVWDLGAAADAVLLPEAKPRAMGEQVVVPSICGRDVACVQRPHVRCGVDALQPLDLGNGPLGVHPSQYLPERREGQFGVVSRKTLTCGFLGCRPIRVSGARAEVQRSFVGSRPLARAAPLPHDDRWDVNHRGH
jgi:hypothetical protein